MMHIDLNADLGEGGPHDRELLSLVTSANISCGVHAGDPDTIADAIRLAIAHRVRIGAHPSFPDRQNFGRSEMQLPFATLRNHMLYQLGAIDALVKAQGAQISHIKPHGALYNQAATDPTLAEDLAMIFQEFNPTLAIVGLAGGELVYAARRANLPVISEVFADRTYTLFGTLVPRSEPGAVIHNSQHAIAQSLTMIREGHLMSIDGHRVKVQADTLCLHGDTPGALAFARQLRAAFAEAGIEVK